MVMVAYLHLELDLPLEKALNHLHDVRNCSPQEDVIRRAKPVWNLVSQNSCVERFC